LAARVALDVDQLAVRDVGELRAANGTVGHMLSTATASRSRECLACESGRAEWLSRASS
jgi:hypothetical protein